MERDPSPEEHGRLILETLVCKLGRKKWAGLAIQAPRSHVLPIDGMAMDLVVCLDRSKSMGRYWSLVVETLFKAIGKLTERDRLGIRTFAGQRHSKPVLSMTVMNKEGQLKAIEALKKIPKPSSGHTNLGAALSEGLDELIKIQNETSTDEPERAMRLLLYTDGKPTVGVKGLEQLVAIRKQKLGKLGPSTKVAVFAYGERHDVKILKSICSDHSSLYFAVTDSSAQSLCEVKLTFFSHSDYVDIVLCLGEFYGGTRTTFFRDLILQIKCPQHCTLHSSFTNRELKSGSRTDGKMWEVLIPDMQSSERRNIILKIPHSVQSGEVQWTLQYYSLEAKRSVTVTRTVDIIRDMSIDDKSKIAIDEQRNRITSINALQKCNLNEIVKAMAQAAINDWKQAKHTVAHQQRRIKHSISRNAPLSRQVSKQLNHYRQTFRRKAKAPSSDNCGFREEADMSAFCQALAAERSSSAGIEAFQTLEKRAQTEVLRDEMEATLTIRRNRAAQRRALAREEKRNKAEMNSGVNNKRLSQTTKALPYGRPNLGGSYDVDFAPPPTGFGLEAFLKRNDVIETKATPDINGSNQDSAIRPVAPSGLPKPQEQERRLTRKRSLNGHSFDEPSAPPLSYLGASSSTDPASAPSLETLSASPLLLVSKSLDMPIITHAMESPVASFVSQAPDLPSHSAALGTAGRTTSLREAVLSARRANVSVRRKSNSDTSKGTAESQLRSTTTESSIDAEPKLEHEPEPLADGTAERIEEPSEQIRGIQEGKERRGATEAVDLNAPTPAMESSDQTPYLAMSTPVIITPASPEHKLQHVLPLALSPYATPSTETGQPFQPAAFIEMLQHQEEYDHPQPLPQQLSSDVMSQDTFSLGASTIKGDQKSGREGLKKRILQLHQRRRSSSQMSDSAFTIFPLEKGEPEKPKKKRKDDEDNDNDDDLFISGEEERSEQATNSEVGDEQKLVDTSMGDLLHQCAHENSTYISPMESPKADKYASSDEYSDEEDPSKEEYPHNEWSWSGSSDEELEEEAEVEAEEEEEEEEDDDENEDFEPEEQVIVPRERPSPSSPTVVTPGQDNNLTSSALFMNLPQVPSISSFTPNASLDDLSEETVEALTRACTASALRRRASKRWNQSNPNAVPTTTSTGLKPSSPSPTSSTGTSPRGVLHPLQALKQYAADPQFRPRKLASPVNTPGALHEEKEESFPEPRLKLAMPSPPSLQSSIIIGTVARPSTLAEVVSLARNNKLPSGLLSSPVLVTTEAVTLEQAPESEQKNGKTENTNDEYETNTRARPLPLRRVSFRSKQSRENSFLYNSTTSFTFSAPAYIEPVAEEDNDDQTDREESESTPRYYEEQADDEQDDVERKDGSDTDEKESREEMVEPLPPSSRKGSLTSSGASSVTPLSSSTNIPTSLPPQSPLTHSHSFDLRQLIVQVDEQCLSSGEGEDSSMNRSEAIPKSTRREALITVRSAATTLEQLLAKIEGKFPGRGRVTRIGVWLGPAESSSVGASTNSWLIPIETDDDVEELIHGNVLRVRFEN